MCGIAAIISKRNVVRPLVESLKCLEYRGYDSAGLAVITNNEIQRVRSVGRVSTMEAAIDSKLSSHIGIAHVRWATHGGVTEPNAHPHFSNNELAIVHNGIIENYEEKREQLRALGYHFESQTDSEVIAHLIHHHYSKTKDLTKATQLAVKELVGAYSVAVMSLHHHDKLVCAHMGCPILIGLGENENLIASDISAVLSATRNVVFLEEGDVAEIDLKSVKIADKHAKIVNRPIHNSDLSLSLMELGPYKHFMQKEIHEQPKVLSDTIEPILSDGFVPGLFGDTTNILANIEAVQILACGTSYYAGLIARNWIESIAKIPCAVEIASEYRSRDSVPNPKQLIVTISQSGETRDTMEALKHAYAIGHKHSLSICNRRGSEIPRASNLVFYTRAGNEVGVASTKGFTTQLIALFALTATIAKLKGRLTKEQEAQYLDALRHLPGSVQHALNLEPQIRVWSEKFAAKDHALFLGRGIHFPIALEGALKLKEISYIHAEAYPAGELKHGPLALVDSNMPVIVIAPNDALLEKVKSNMQEVRARGGELYVLADLDSHFGSSEGVNVIRSLRHAGVLSPIVHAIPMQLLAYHAGLQRGTDVDKPRNLAKSVTVE